MARQELGKLPATEPASKHSVNRRQQGRDGRKRGPEVRQRFVIGKQRLRWVRLSLTVVVGFSVGITAGRGIQFPVAHAHTGCPSATIIGTSGNDALHGDGGGSPDHDHDDYIDGKAGNDAIRGYTCGDSLIGGGGPDSIHGAFGADTIQGGDGHDHPNVCGLLICGDLIGGGGSDLIEGNANSDMPDDDYSPDADTLRGGDGDDDVDGEDGDPDDSISGGAGSDDCWKDSGDSTSGCERVF